MIKKILILIIFMMLNFNIHAAENEKKVKNDCSNISKFSPKFVLCKAGKGAGKVKGALKLSKIKEAYENRPTKGKKTLVDVFKKDKKDN
tara:strand:- start:258 stop:524 length:267 start_codon:yes stop_codon:yes gene_type:complete